MSLHNVLDILVVGVRAVKTVKNINLFFFIISRGRIERSKERECVLAREFILRRRRASSKTPRLCFT